VIFVVPALSAVTNPVVAFTVATEVLLLDHAPPVVALLLYVAAAPIQSGEGPLTVPADTFGETVKVLKELTPLTV
jgi:hypothetical protein